LVKTSDKEFATDMETVFELLPENIKEEIEKGLEEHVKEN
jgi:hypothetical protein